MYITAWGVLEVAGGPVSLANLALVCDKVKALGYSGIELPVAFAMQYGSSKFQALFQEKGLQWIAQVFSSGVPPIPGNLGVASEFGIEHPSDATASGTHDVAHHKKIWTAQVQEAAKLRPILRSITSHTGKDYYTDAEADDMFSHCVKVEEELGVQVNHETHRARILYSPWVASRVVERHPKLHLCADLSHFSVVAEAGMADPELNKVVAQLTPRIRHIHARVGFEEGPQVPDPRGPRWRPYFNGYMKWWEAIYKARMALGDSSMSTTPEFGPPMYCWTHPFTNEPLVSVWDVNHWVGIQVTKMFGYEVNKEGAATLLEDPDNRPTP